MTSRAQDYYAKDITRALATPGGNLRLGRGGFTLHYENARLSGYDYATIKQQALSAGLAIIDSRKAPLGLVARLVIRGPMIAVNVEPNPPPWYSLAYAPLAVVAAAYRRIGAEVLNIPETDAQEEPRFQPSAGELDSILGNWLGHVEQDEH